MFALNEQKLVTKLIADPFFITMKVEGAPVRLLIDTGLGVTLILDGLCSPENRCVAAVRP